MNIVDPFLQGAFCTLALWLIFSRHAYTAGFLMLVSQVASKLAYPVDRWQNKTFRYGMFVLFFSAVWATAFLVGYQRSYEILLSTVPTEKIVVENRLEISAALIRAGERGILFKSFATGKLSFLRGETIKQIDAF